MQEQTVKFTYREYLLLPEQDRRELIGGDFYVVPAPNVRHQNVVANLGIALQKFVKKNVLGMFLLGPIDVVLSDEDVVQPDILFISKDRLGILTEDNVRGAPDLVVEVLSPSTADRDRRLKLALYTRYGVREYWIVDPEAESVQVMELGSRGSDSIGTFTSGVVPSTGVEGFEMEVSRIFSR